MVLVASILLTSSTGVLGTGAAGCIGAVCTGDSDIRCDSAAVHRLQAKRWNATLKMPCFKGHVWMKVVGNGTELCPMTRGGKDCDNVRRACLEQWHHHDGRVGWRRRLLA
eukprot:365366-Chlamydomonas_euryale.AAC.20